MSLLTKKFKRQHFPIEGVEGLFARPMKDSEAKRQQQLTDDEDKVWFSCGMCLVDENGSPLLTKECRETDADFARRVRKTLDDNDFDFLLLSKTCNAIAKASKYDPESIRKN